MPGSQTDTAAHKQEQAAREQAQPALLCLPLCPACRIPPGAGGTPQTPATEFSSRSSRDAAGQHQVLMRHSLSWKTQSVPAAPGTDAGDTGPAKGQAGRTRRGGSQHGEGITMQVPTPEA